MIGKRVSFFRPEIMHGGDACYVFEMSGQFVDKLKEDAWLTVAEREDSMNECKAFLLNQRSRRVTSEHLSNIVIFVAQNLDFGSFLKQTSLVNVFLIMCALCSSTSRVFTVVDFGVTLVTFLLTIFESVVRSAQPFIFSSGFSIRPLFSTGTLDLVQTSISEAEAFWSHSDYRPRGPCYAGSRIGIQRDMIDCYTRNRTQRLGDRMARLEASEVCRHERSVVGQTSQTTSALTHSQRVGKIGPVKTVRVSLIVGCANVELPSASHVTEFPHQTKNV